MSAPAADPPVDCSLCSRLVALRRENRKLYPSFYNGAVASFGDTDARVLVLGLAPGLKGANRTGRPFTGDSAGGILYTTLRKHGFASGAYDENAEDGLLLNDSMITNAVRCLPPQNKPTAAEINTCRPFLLAQLQALPRLKVVLALGRIAHDSLVRAHAARLRDYPFSHNKRHQLPNGPVLIDSYHCSRYNLNTGRLTGKMFDEVFDHIRKELPASTSM